MTIFKSDKKMRLLKYKENESGDTIFGNALFLGVSKEDGKFDQLDICTTDKVLQEKLKVSEGKRFIIVVAVYNYDQRTKIKLLDLIETESMEKEKIMSGESR